MERKEEKTCENGQVHEVKQGNRSNPEGRSNLDDHQDRQRNAKWRVFDIDWEKNVISKNVISAREMACEVGQSFFVAIFTEKGIRDQILSSKNWFFDKSPLYMQLWTPNFNPLKLAVYETPIWIGMYNLPIEYWGDSCLEKIGQTLGTLLEIDEGIIENDSYIYARMKIAVVEQIPPLLTLRTDNGIWKQGIEVEKESYVCQRCGKSEINNVERVAIPSQILSPIPGFQAVNIDENCTSDTEGSSSDWEGEDDVLDNLDPKCIIQSANTLLGRAKGVKGKKNHKQIKEEKASEKGIVSVLEYMKNSKGGSPSLGQI
ncbi:hypothetical protein SUGI_0292330 [Cryptomeria japonica]|nr:hypothetical protein SUGI_0292330 [Cryptomeria japonica]